MRKTIGIIGAGHLGLSLAKTFVKNGYEKSLIYLSFSGNDTTFRRIKDAGFENNITSNDEICSSCDLIFLALRPSGVNILSSLQFNNKTTVVSCIAGFRQQQIERLINHKIIRIMPSSPMTIENGLGISAIFPENTHISDFLSKYGKITHYNLSEESMFNIFTAANCLPAAYLQLEIINGNYSSDSIENLYGSEFPYWGDIVRWSHRVTPKNLSAEEKKCYIEKMATKGGITEAIVNSIKNGLSLVDSFKAGVRRSVEISKSL